MEVFELELQGLLKIVPTIYRDDRGWFFESYNHLPYAQFGVTTFVQDNHSSSTRGTLRGLHYQRSPGQAKLMRVVSGRIFDVAVDIRPTSPTFGRWTSLELDAVDHAQFYIPVGFAHGFYVLSEVAEVLYKVSTPYIAAEECTLAWDDPTLAVAWPDHSPVLSARDKAGESFEAYRKRIVP